MICTKRTSVMTAAAGQPASRGGPAPNDVVSRWLTPLSTAWSESTAQPNSSPTKKKLNRKKPMSARVDRLARRRRGKTARMSTRHCSGLARQFRIGTVVAGESLNFAGGLDWLRSCGTRVVDLESSECVRLLSEYIAAHPDVWNEDIGEL